MSDRESSPQSDQSPPGADGVVVQVTDILRSYLSADSSFTPAMAVDRVRSVINSRAGMSAFVQDALQPGELDAETLVVSLAAALDDHGPSSEETVLRLIDITESSTARVVYDRATPRRNPADAEGLN